MKMTSKKLFSMLYGSLAPPPQWMVAQRFPNEESEASFRSQCANIISAHDKSVTEGTILNRSISQIPQDLTVARDSTTDQVATYSSCNKTSYKMQPSVEIVDK